MPATQPKRLTLADVLNAANKHYDNNYMSLYFETKTGASKVGSGDTLARFVVTELRDTFDHTSSRQRQVMMAIHALQNVQEDVQRAIQGLQELKSTM